MIEQGITPKILTRGNKLLLLSIPSLNIRFLDSMLYCQSSLSAFAARYRIKEKKGYFPHALSGMESLQINQKGLPDFKYFSPCYDKKEMREQKRWWYDNVDKDYEWNYQTELLVTI